MNASSTLQADCQLLPWRRMPPPRNHQGSLRSRASIDSQVIDYYKDKGRVNDLKADQQPSQVADDIRTMLQGSLDPKPRFGSGGLDSLPI